MSTNTVKAKCIIEVEVTCDSVWTDDTTMAQIIKQARADATHRIEKLFEDAGTSDAELSVQRRDARGIALLGIKKIYTQAVSE